MTLLHLVCLVLAVACANALVQSQVRFTLSSAASTMRSRTHLHGLALRQIEVPVQEDPGNYAALLKKIIPPEKILKWNISKIEESKCFIEVIVDEEAS